MKRAVAAVMSGLALMTVASQALAAETVTYTYDAVGRVISVQHTGGASNNLHVTYNYDPADNKTAITVSGGVPANSRVVVLPIAGFIVIPLP